MKNLVFAIVAAVAMNVLAEGEAPVSLVNDPNGYSYLKINQDMENFAFKSDFKSIGNSGMVGVFKYSDGLEGDALKDYIANYNPIDPQFMKKLNEGLVSLGDVKEGERYGFYLLRNNGDLVRLWDFQYDKKGTAYIAFDKNDSPSSKDEWMSIGEYSFNTSNPDPGPGPLSGAPLPGALAVLLVGGAFVGVRKFRKRG